MSHWNLKQQGNRNNWRALDSCQHSTTNTNANQHSNCSITARGLVNAVGDDFSEKKWFPSFSKYPRPFKTSKEDSRAHQAPLPREPQGEGGL